MHSSLSNAREVRPAAPLLWHHAMHSSSYRSNGGCEVSNEGGGTAQQLLAQRRGLIGGGSALHARGSQLALQALRALGGRRLAGHHRLQLAHSRVQLARAPGLQNK